MGSVRRRGDQVRVALDASEVTLVISLTSQVIELLGVGNPVTDGEPAAPSAEESLQSLQSLLDGTTDPVEAPRDPTLLRLLPDAYRDDNEAAGEFRRLTEADLRATKNDGLGRIVIDLLAPESAQRGGGVRLELDEEAASIWLTALNDVRLALGTRIDVSEDMDDERMNLPVDSRRYAEIATYDWLSWLQDAILRAVMRG
jgi:hypothetical protein